jgi:hypothetical protein
VSTTTGRDLLARAESLAKELAHYDHPVKTAAWESFDTTVYRLLREVIGPARSDSGATTQTRARLLHVIHSYPTPLRPPLDTELTAAAAARFVPWSDTQFRERIHRGDVEATVTGHTYAIESRVLDRRTDIAPADPTDAHPLARLATTLGALADMASQERGEPRTPDAMDDQAAVDVTARILSYASVAARYTLRHGPVVDGDRPLAVAQYAERSVDALGAAASMASLDALVARIATNGTEPHERLDSAIQRWSAASHAELSRTIPSTQVMANIADLGAMMLAATHHLRTLEPNPNAEERKKLTVQLRSGADALKAASAAWKTVSTLQPQSHEFGTASLELFNMIREVITTPAGAERGSPTGHEVDQALGSLARGVDDLKHFMARAHDATRACLNSSLLFGPARSLRASAGRLNEVRRGVYVPLDACDAQGLLTLLESASDLPLHLPAAAVPAPHIALSR